MADISKCNGKGCKVKKKCYRFMVESNIYQTWADFNNELGKDGNGCKYFMEYEKRK